LGGGREVGYQWSHIVFAHAVLITAVPFDQIAVVALFHTIQHAVTTTWKGTILATESVGSIGILQTGITLFTRINHAVPAESEDEMTVCRAAIGQSRTQDRRFALLSEGTLDDRVSAGTPFEVAVSGTAIEITTIGIITFFSGIEDSVATGEI